MLKRPFEPKLSRFDPSNGAQSATAGIDTDVFPSDEMKRFVGPPPNWASSLICTCSS